MVEVDSTLLPALLRALAEDMRNNGEHLYRIDHLRLAADRLDALVAEVERLRHELDAAQLRSIEARNPGIDMDEVQQVRARLLGGDQ